RSVVETRERIVEARPRAELEDEVAPRGAKRPEDSGEHPPQPRRAVRREQPQPLRLTAGTELCERRLERLTAEHRALRLVEPAEGRVEPGGERIRLQQPVAEAVNRRDPSAVELAREIGVAELEQSRPDPRAQLPGGALRVRDDEHGRDVEAVVADRADEALHEHLRLAGAGARGDEDPAGRLDGRVLLGVHARATRQTRQRSHHEGHEPPPRSWPTSPSPIPPATPPP